MTTVNQTTIHTPAFRALHYPLALCGIATAFYSFATTLLWPLALHFSKTSSQSELGMPPDDYAGYIAYVGTLPFFLLFSGLYAIRHWWLVRTGFPGLKTILLSILTSSLIMAAPWIALGLFFERQRFQLPGDGNWPAISAMAGLTAIHLWLLLSLPKPVQVQVTTRPVENRPPASASS